MIGWLNHNAGFITAIFSCITIFAMIYAPIIALKVQKKVDAHEKREEMKKEVFVTLLSTRARSSRLYVEHVKALNVLDIIYYGDKKIIEAWTVYRDHLNTRMDENDCSKRIWFEKQDDYFVDLLYAMSNYFEYSFDKVLLKKGAYLPVAHGDYQSNMSSIIKGLNSIIEGEKTIGVSLKA